MRPRARAEGKGMFPCLGSTVNSQEGQWRRKGPFRRNRTRAQQPSVHAGGPRETCARGPRAAVRVTQPGGVFPHADWGWGLGYGFGEQTWGPRYCWRRGDRLREWE